MHNYTIQYSINNTYEKPVQKAFFQLVVLPMHNHSQSVVKIETESSLKSYEHSTENQYGCMLLQYSTQKIIHQFDFKLYAKVRLHDINPYNFISQPAEIEHQELKKDSFILSNALYLMPTPLTNIPIHITKQWVNFQPHQQVMDFLLALNQSLHSGIKYQTGVTTTETSALEALQLKQGVCQDFAHIFIAIARNWGIPARYTSGYLNLADSRGSNTQTHAWVEAFVPFIGWIGFDPTNNLLIDHHYIKIAHGTDYRDCSPITGIIETTGEQLNDHFISITNQ